MKTLVTRCNGAGAQQLSLLPEPALSVEWPSASSKAGAALALLLQGLALTQADYPGRADSWRLAAYVKDLKDKGWPVESERIAAPTRTNRARSIARYWLADSTIRKARTMRGAA